MHCMHDMHSHCSYYADVEFEKVSWKQLDDTSEDELGVVDINDSLDLIRHKRVC